MNVLVDLLLVNQNYNNDIIINTINITDFQKERHCPQNDNVSFGPHNFQTEPGLSFVGRR